MVFLDIDPFGIAGGLTYGLKGQFPHRGGWFPAKDKCFVRNKTYSFAGPDIRGGTRWGFAWWYVGGYHYIDFEFKDGKWVPIRTKTIPDPTIIGGGGKSGGGGATRTWDEPDGGGGDDGSDETWDPIVPLPNPGNDTEEVDSTDGSSEGANWDDTAHATPDDTDASNEVLGSQPTSVDGTNIDLPEAKIDEFWVIDEDTAYSSLGRTAEYNDSLGRWDYNDSTSRDAYEYYMILAALGDEPTWQSLPEPGQDSPSGDIPDYTTDDLGLEDSEDLSEDDFYGNTPEE